MSDTIYTEEDLKDLHKFIKDKCKAKNEKDEPLVSMEDRILLKELADQLGQVALFDPYFFLEVLTDQGTGAEKVLLEALDDLALHVNDKDIVTKTIFEWRFQRDK